MTPEDCLDCPKCGKRTVYLGKVISCPICGPIEEVLRAIHPKRVAPSIPAEAKKAVVKGK